MTPTPSPSPGVAPEGRPPPEQERDLRGHGERIERLLEELRGMAGPSTWARFEEALRLVLELHGRGLERLLQLASDTDATPLEVRVCDDELVSSLLLLHGLHPLGVAERVRGAVERVRSSLGPAGAGLELLEVRADGVVRVRAPAGRRGGCPSSSGSLARALERAVQEAAPEVARVEVEAAGEEGDGRLVSIGAPRAGRPTP